MLPILCLPATRGDDLNALNMNYTCLIYGGTMTLAMLWYAISARKWFKGPKINVEHIIHGVNVDANASDEKELEAPSSSDGKEDSTEAVEKI